MLLKLPICIAEPSTYIRWRLYVEVPMCCLVHADHASLSADT